MHVCVANYEGSSLGMESHGTLALFKRSLNYGLRYRYLMSDGDSKSHSLILEDQPYGSGKDDVVVKKDRIGHIQKRMGNALRELKRWHKEKLSDGKTIGGVGCLTDTLSIIAIRDSLKR